MSFELIKQKESISEQSAKKIALIESAINRMTHQIDDVMNYVKTTRPKLGTYKLDDLVRDAVNYANLPESVSVNTQTDKLQIHCDYQKMHIVLVNLFRNASEAMSFKGNIILKAQKTGQKLKIIIENSGPPIPPDDLENIFDPLFTTKETGTGLGLATCANLVESHKGSIYAENNPTRFVINLPQI